MRELDVPTAWPGEVLVKVVAGALNPADLNVVFRDVIGAAVRAIAVTRHPRRVGAMLAKAAT